MSISAESILHIASLLQGSLAAVTVIAIIPQWTKLLQKKSSADISLASWIIWTFANSISLFYACCQFYVIGIGMSLIMATSVSVICNFVTIYLIALYRTNPAQAANKQNTASHINVPDTYLAYNLEVEASNLYEALNPVVESYQPENSYYH